MEAEQGIAYTPPARTPCPRRVLLGVVLGASLCATSQAQAQDVGQALGQALGGLQATMNQSVAKAEAQAITVTPAMVTADPRARTAALVFTNPTADTVRVNLTVMIGSVTVIPVVSATTPSQDWKPPTVASGSWIT